MHHIHFLSHICFTIFQEWHIIFLVVAHFVTQNRLFPPKSFISFSLICYFYWFFCSFFSIFLVVCILWFLFFVCMFFFKFISIYILLNYYCVILVEHIPSTLYFLPKWQPSFATLISFYLIFVFLIIIIFCLFHLYPMTSVFCV